MKKLLEWAVGELIAPRPLRKNHILGEVNHAGPRSVEFLFVDKDKPEQGAVELLQIQVSAKPAPDNVPGPAYSCRVYTLMAAVQPANKLGTQNRELVFSSTQEVIDWLQP